jgi:hypothetical protein
MEAAGMKSSDMFAAILFFMAFVGVLHNGMPHLNSIMDLVAYFALLYLPMRLLARLLERQSVQRK